MTFLNQVRSKDAQDRAEQQRQKQAADNRIASVQGYSAAAQERTARNNAVPHANCRKCRRAGCQSNAGRCMRNSVLRGVRHPYRRAG
jgi:hypothetical protein